MGFSVGSYAKVKEVENKGSYTKAKIVISKKIKGSNPAQYICTYAGWVNLVGNAHKKGLTAGQKIKITNCDVTNGYADKVTNEQKFSNTPMLTLYDFEIEGAAPSINSYMPNAYGSPNFVNNSPSFEELPDSDGLPF